MPLHHVEAIEAETLNIESHIRGLGKGPRGGAFVSMPPDLVGTLQAPVLDAFSKEYQKRGIHVLVPNNVSDLTPYEADVSIRLAELG